MTQFKVALVAFDGLTIPAWAARRLDDVGISLVSKECRSPDDLVSVAADADAVWVFGGSRIVTADSLGAMSRCIAILRTGTGVDNIPVAAATAAGILVVTTPEVATRAVAEHTAALILTLIRQVAAQDRLVRAGEWDRTLAWPRWHLEHQTVGLIGFGAIARALVHKLRGFDLTIVAHDAFVPDNVFAEYGVQRASLPELLQIARIISLHCPLTEDTYHLLGDDQFAMMLDGAILVNTARGALVDEAALERALDAGRLSAAGLDVLEHEPAGADHPLFRHDSVVITPHIAGYSDTYYADSWRQSVDALIDLANGRWPATCVNRDAVVSRRPRVGVADHVGGQA